MELAASNEERRLQAPGYILKAPMTPKSKELSFLKLYLDSAGLHHQL